MSRDDFIACVLKADNSAQASSRPFLKIPLSVRLFSFLMFSAIFGSSSEKLESVGIKLLDMMAISAAAMSKKLKSTVAAASPRGILLASSSTGSRRSSVKSSDRKKIKAKACRYQNADSNRQIEMPMTIDVLCFCHTGNHLQRSYLISLRRATSSSAGVSPSAGVMMAWLSRYTVPL